MHNASHFRWLCLSHLLVAVATGCTAGQGTLDAGLDSGLCYQQLSTGDIARVFETGRTHELPLFGALGPISDGFCVSPPKFLEIDNDAGLSSIQLDLDNGVVRVRAELPGRYYTTAGPGLWAESYFFANAPSKAPIAVQSLCREVRRLAGNLWACDGAVYDADGRLIRNDATDWLPLAGGVVRIDDAGVAYGNSASDMQPRYWLNSPHNVARASTDDSGVSLFTVDQSFWECRLDQPTCIRKSQLDGGTFGGLEGGVLAVHRFEGRTIFASSWVDAHFCDVESEVCRVQEGTSWFDAASGRRIYTRGLIVSGPPQVSLQPMEWNGTSWEYIFDVFTGPIGYRLSGSPRAARVLFRRNDKHLALAWYDSVNKLEVYTEPNATVTGAGDDYFWASDFDAGITHIYPR
jgi:hypothetical protein